MDQPKPLSGAVCTNVRKVRSTKQFRSDGRFQTRESTFSMKTCVSCRSAWPERYTSAELVWRAGITGGRMRPRCGTCRIHLTMKGDYTEREIGRVTARTVRLSFSVA